LLKLVKCWRNNIQTAKISQEMTTIPVSNRFVGAGQAGKHLCPKKDMTSRLSRPVRTKRGETARRKVAVLKSNLTAPPRPYEHCGKEYRYDDYIRTPTKHFAPAEGAARH
jgi:hypothetical protein